MKKLFSFLYRHRIDFLVLSILLMLIFGVFFLLPQNEVKSIVRYLENKTFDIRQNIIAKNKNVNKDIIIITVDDPSYEYLIAEYGDWPVPRHVYADVLHYVQAQNPKYVAFDLLFIKPLNRVPHSDEQLINAFKKYNNTYTAINFDHYSYDLRLPPFIDEKITSKITINSPDINISQYTNCRIIQEEIINATDKIGHINTPKSDDGFIRSLPVLINYKTDEYNSYMLYMTIKLAIDYLNKYENQNINSIVINKNNTINLGTRTLPLTKDGEVILNWYGESGVDVDTTFKYVSFWEVLKSYEAQKRGEKEILPPDTFKDKIVYVGTSVFSLSDIKTVPTSKYLPGVELHATLLNNIIDNNLIQKAPIVYNILISLILAVIAFIIAFKIRSVAISIFLFSILIFAQTYLATIIMDKYNMWLWIVVPLLTAFFIFVCSFIIKYLLKSRDFEYTYKLATTDGLTELYNHRFFQETMKNLLENATRTKENFSLILLDIDFFKKFNDKYGHQAGDAVLKHVAKTLKSCVRNEDFVCRYGGEEMTVVLPKVNHATAINVAQKICDTIASKQYALTPDLEVSITVSLGVATYPLNGKTPAELIEYADKCLYKAKENGRNQVGNVD